MRETIIRKLHEIEKTENVRILLVAAPGVLRPRTVIMMCDLSMFVRRRTISVWRRSGM